MPRNEPRDRGVSPVIGSILIVAITVIMAAVVGSFVVDLQQGTETAPQANFEFDRNGSNVTVSHEGGQTYDVDNSDELAIETTGGTVADGFDVTDDVTVGDTATVTGLDDGDRVRVVWVGPEAETSRIVASFELPE